MASHSRAILAIMRTISAAPRYAEVTVKRHRYGGRATYIAAWTAYETDHVSGSRIPCATGHIAAWCPSTGDLYAAVGDWSRHAYREDTGERIAYMNRERLDALASYGAEYGNPRPAPAWAARPLHYALTPRS